MVPIVILTKHVQKSVHLSSKLLNYYLNQRSEIYWVYLTGRRPARHPHDDVGRRLLRFVLDFGPATHKIGGATRASVIMSDARSAAAAVSERISF